MRTGAGSVFAFFLVAALLFVTVFAPFGLAHGACHVCSGEGCPICAMILSCASAYAHLSRLMAVLIVVSAAWTGLFLLLQEIPCVRRDVSPVGRGIRLLN